MILMKPLLKGSYIRIEWDMFDWFSLSLGSTIRYFYKGFSRKPIRQILEDVMDVYKVWCPVTIKDDRERWISTFVDSS